MLIPVLVRPFLDKHVWIVFPQNLGENSVARSGCGLPIRAINNFSGVSDLRAQKRQPVFNARYPTSTAAHDARPQTAQSHSQSPGPATSAATRPQSPCVNKRSAPNQRV